MEMIIMSNGQLGISCLERNGNFRCIYGGKYGLSSSWLPGFWLPWSVNEGKKIRVFGVRIKALSLGHSDGSVVGAGILEKEFEFKPSFDEYLKAMESVKAGRETKQARKLDRNKLNELKGCKKSLLEGDEKTRKSKELLDQPEMSKIRENDHFSEDDRRSAHKDVVGSKLECAKREYAMQNEGLSGKGSGVIARRFGGVKRDGRLLSNHGGCMNPRLGDLNLNDGYKTRDFGKSGEMPNDIEIAARTVGRGMNGSRGRSEMLRRKEHDFEEEVSANSRRMSLFERNQWEVSRSTGKEIIHESRSRGILKRYSLEDDDDSLMEVERAAFRSFEDLDGIIGKPKVTKREMEERIQKLAKCLNGADIDIPEWIFSKMMRSTRVKFNDHTILRVIQLLGQLGNWRRVLQVIEWLQTRERYKSNRLRHVFTTALDVLGKARRPVEALNVFRAMQQQMASYPDIVAYHSIAVTLGQAGHMKELFDVIDDMRSPPKKRFKTGALENWDPRLEPDIVVYNAVLNACVRQKQWEGAFWVLQQLKQHGQQPSTATYGLIMEVMLSCGKYNLVHEFFRKMQKTSIPNALVYKVLVNTLWREGKADEAILTVQDMERRGIVGSAALYYDLARCLCSAGRVQEALKQVEKICRVASKPLVITYTGLIQACVDSGHIEGAAHIFNHMSQFCFPNLVTYNIMLKAYLEHGFFEEASKLFCNMAEGGNLISCKSDKHFRVLPDIYTFNTMLDACISGKRWDDFNYVYGRMLHHGHHFNAKRHLRMIFDALRSGKVEPLEITWKHMARTERSPPPPLVKERFCLMLERDDYDSALACIQPDLRGELPAFSKSAWLNFLKDNPQRFRRDKLIRLLHEGNLHLSRSSSPNPVLQNLLTSCNEILRTCADVPIGMSC